MVRGHIYHTAHQVLVLLVNVYLNTPYVVSHAIYSVILTSIYYNDTIYSVSVYDICSPWMESGYLNNSYLLISIAALWQKYTADHHLLAMLKMGNLITARCLVTECIVIAVQVNKTNRAFHSHRAVLVPVVQASELAFYGNVVATLVGREFQLRRRNRTRNKEHNQHRQNCANDDPETTPTSLVHKHIVANVKGLSMKSS